MTTRHQRLLSRALSRLKMSPERFADECSASAAYYSGRQLRRFLAGDAMPNHLADALREFHAALDTKEARNA